MRVHQTGIAIDDDRENRRRRGASGRVFERSGCASVCHALEIVCYKLAVHPRPPSSFIPAWTMFSLTEYTPTIARSNRVRGSIQGTRKLFRREFPRWKFSAGKIFVSAERDARSTPGIEQTARPIEIRGSANGRPLAPWRSIRGV